jgi:hypothetical protein
VFEDELGHATLVVDREELAAEGATKGLLERVGCGRGAVGDEEVNRDLQIARTHRDLDAAIFASGFGENPRDGRLTRPEQPKASSCRPMGSGEDPPHRFVLDDTRPEAPQLARRSRKRDGDPPVVIEEHGGRRPGEAERNAAGGEGSLLPHTGREVGVRSAQLFGDRAGDRLDLGF